MPPASITGVRTPEESAGVRLILLQRLIAAFGFALVTSSYRLWTPQSVYPQVPLLGWASTLPGFVDWLAFGAMGASLVALLFGGAVHRSGATRQGGPWRAAVSRAGWLGLIAAFCGACLTDQHRCQAWAYQFVLVGVLFLLARKPTAALSGTRLLVVSIYLYSGLSKLDHAFITGYGQQLWSALLVPTGISLELQSEGLRRFLAACLPLGEIAAGLAILWPRTRRWGCWAAILMHVLLIVALGPLGWNHEPGVLLWNAYFIGQAVILFGFRSNPRSVPEPKHAAADPAAESRRAGRVWSDEQPLALALTVILVAPLLEPFGWIDHWPGWALYAANSERVVVQLDVSGELALPPELEPYFSAPEFYSQWGRLYIYRWSVRELGCPIYPDDRFRFGVAYAIGTQWEQLQERMRIQYQSRADRWSGMREQTQLRFEDIPEFCDDRFVLNWRPRSNLAH